MVRREKFRGDCRYGAHRLMEDIIGHDHPVFLQVSPFSCAVLTGGAGVAIGGEHKRCHIGGKKAMSRLMRKGATRALVLNLGSLRGLAKRGVR
jgi:hypothetical protein